MLLVAEPILGSEEKAALSSVIDGGWITMADRVRNFEREFAAKHGATDAVAVSSCTAALHLILRALGLGPGDEILVPSLTFVATVNSVLYVGATPVFVDIEDVEWPLMCPADAAAKCSVKSKAIILMHYAGMVADRQIWRTFAQSRGLILIEDAAHAVGADQVGTFGDAAAFSFYGNKNMTTAEGGAVLSRHGDLLEKIRQMRGHGMTTTTLQRLSDRNLSYDVTMLGYNYRMDELRAAIGLEQLRHLASWNEKRRLLTAFYRTALGDHCPAVRVPFANRSRSTEPVSCHHIMPVIIPEGVDRQRIADGLKSAAIQTSIHYPAVHHFSFYRSRFPHVRLPRTEEFAARELTLPLHPRMTERHVNTVALALAETLAKERRSPQHICQDVRLGARTG